MSMAYALGIDVGGTFTDFTVLNRDSGSTVSFKVESTPSDPTQAIINGLHELADVYGISVKQITYLVQGNTIGVNTIIERSGAKLGLFVTEGFRDILELQRMRVDRPFDFSASRPEPLIPRKQVWEVAERLRVDGSVSLPMDANSVERATKAASQDNVEGIVICFLHSYKNGTHELAASKAIRALNSELPVTCSHEAWPQSREYERAMVGVLNAYIQPRLSSFLRSLMLLTGGAGLRRYGTGSNGGVMTIESAEELPVQTLLSGPASGVIGSTYLAQAAGYGNLITLDMGGTSADIAIVKDGAIGYSNESYVGDYPVITPSIGMSSIGAGGGSIARIDRSGLLKVGPESAGADPGPACYGRGGKAPTLTDAYLVCGLLNVDRFAGGKVRLDEKQARLALQGIAEDLGISVDEAAEAIIEVATATMYSEARHVIASHGIDPRDYALVAFGGAGPTHAPFLAPELHLQKILVPPSPGTLCSLGALIADVKRDFVRTVNLDLSHVTAAMLVEEYSTVRDRALDWLDNQEVIGQRATTKYSADIRYRHQAYELELIVDPDWIRSGELDRIVSGFHDLHQKVYGHADPSAPLELINIRVTAVGLTSKPPLAAKSTHPSARAQGARTIRYRGKMHEAALYERTALRIDQRVEGPAIVEQDDTTVLIPPGFFGRVDRYGTMIIEVPLDSSA